MKLRKIKRLTIDEFIQISDLIRNNIRSLSIDFLRLSANFKSQDGDSIVIEGEIHCKNVTHKYVASITYVFNEFILEEMTIYTGIEMPSE